MISACFLLSIAISSDCGVSDGVGGWLVRVVMVVGGVRSLWLGGVKEEEEDGAGRAVYLHLSLSRLGQCSE